MGKLRDEQIETALADPHPGVRRQAVRLAESRLKSSPKLLAAVLKLADDPDAVVALQLACSLGETDDPRKIAALATLTQKHANDAYVTTGVMTSVKDDELGPLLKLVFTEPQRAAGQFGKPADGTRRHCDERERRGDRDRLGREPGRRRQTESIRRARVAAGRPAPQSAQDGCVNRATPPSGCNSSPNNAWRVANDADADVATRAVCIRVVGRTPQPKTSHIQALGDFLSADHDSQLQLAAIDALAERNQPDVADVLLGAWRTFTPALRDRALDVLLSPQAMGRRCWPRSRRTPSRHRKSTPPIAPG